MSLQTLDSQISYTSLLVPGIFVVLAALYLVAIPLLLYFWMNTRWHIMGKYERLGIYGLVFLFFPGLILFSPLLNLRLNGQDEG